MFTEKDKQKASEISLRISEECNEFVKENMFDSISVGNLINNFFMLKLAQLENQIEELRGGGK